MNDAQALALIADPISPKTFLQEYFDQKPLHVARNEPNRFAQWFTFADCDEMLSRTNLRYPIVRLFQGHEPVPPEDYLRSWRYGYDDFHDSVDNAAVLHLLDEGATVNIMSLNRSWPPLARLCALLESTFFFPVNANAFLTPPNADHVKPHFDTTDNIIIQVGGSKNWQVWPIKGEKPLRMQGSNPREVAEIITTKPFLEAKLCQGDTLYVPRGWTHHAETTSEWSLHLVISVDTSRWYDLLARHMSSRVKQFEEDVRWRRCVRIDPIYQSDEERRSNAAQFNEMLAQYIGQMSLSGAFTEQIENFVLGRYPTRQGEVIKAIDCYGHEQLDGILHWQDAAPVYTWRTEGNMILLTLAGQQFELPEHYHEALMFALQTPRFAIHQLPRLQPTECLKFSRVLLDSGLWSKEVP